MSCKTDFSININSSRDIRILQITDFQPIDPSQIRYEMRLGGRHEKTFPIEEKNVCLYDNIRESIAKSKPDLIIITGDIVYGEFDDNG